MPVADGGESEVRGVEAHGRAVLKASVARRYEDKNGDWKSSQSFSRNEMLLAIHCPQQAVAKNIKEEQAQNSSARSTVDEEVVV